MDIAKASRNQDLITMIRSGQMAADDLHLCEMGIDSCMDMAISFQASMESPILDVIDIDAREALQLSAMAASIVERANGILSAVPVMIARDPSLAPIMAVTRCGFLRAERNIMMMRDYMEGVSGWQSSAMVIKRYISSVREDARRAIGISDRARVTLVDENINLIKSVAYTSCRRDSDRFNDMFGVAGAQFVICMDQTYNPNSKPHVLFTTYATKCMISRCLGAMATPQSLARIPNAKHSLATGVLSGEISVDADEVSDPSQRRQEADIRRSIKSLGNPISLDAPLSDEGTSTIGDISVSGMDDGIGRILDEVAVIGIVDKALRNASREHRMVVDQRLGIRGGNSSNTLSDIAKMLNRDGVLADEVSRQRIGQIWINACERISKHMEERDEDS